MKSEEILCESIFSISLRYWWNLGVAFLLLVSIYISFSHTRQWMIEKAHEIQLWILRVHYISRQLYYIGHVTSIVCHCFQGRPYDLAELTSLWRHDFSPDTQSATDGRSCFQKFICPLFNESVFYGVFGVGLRFVLLEQTKRLDAEFKYLSIWVKSTLLNSNKNNSSRK